MKYFVLVILLLELLVTIKACHSPHDGGSAYGRRKRSTDGEYDDYNETENLVDFFTECMTSTSNMTSMDWYSITDWTVEDSNWYYYTDADCDGEYGEDETSCWMEQVNVFLIDSLSPMVQRCIAGYAEEFSYSEEVESEYVSRRKKRQSQNPRPGHSVNKKSGSGTGRTTQMPPPSSSKPPPKSTRPPRNSQCPSIPNDYRRELSRLVPPNFRPPKPRYRRKRSLEEEESFNITNVVDFIDEFTVCDDCERYSGESAVACFTDRFDRLTRYDSPIKMAIQQVNSRYAEGGDIVGNCRGSVYWTEWFNVDNPRNGNGDSETLQRIRESGVGHVCSNPKGIQAQLSSNTRPFGRGNNFVEISPESGLVCRNSAQTRGLCQDYRVRFCCRDYIGKCSSKSGWTQYFDRSKPSGNGEFETFDTGFVASQINLLCEQPTAIGARLVLNKSPFQLSGDVLHIRPSFGLYCFNRQQVSGRECGDYEVRYCCPPIVGKCQHGHHWTKWYQNSATAFGDYETLSRIKRRSDYRCTSEPSAIEAEIAKSRRPYIEGNNRLILSPTSGLICDNRLQVTENQCKDYRVRFCCKQPARRWQTSPHKQKETPPPPPPSSPPPSSGMNRKSPPPSQSPGRNLGGFRPPPPPNFGRNSGSSQSSSISGRNGETSNSGPNPTKTSPPPPRNNQNRRPKPRKP